MNNIKGTHLFWTAGFILLCVFLALISNILFPFVVSLILAYFLDPAADKLERFGFSRIHATLFIIGVFFLICTLITFLLVPLLYDQFLLFTDKFPIYIQSIKERFLPSILRFAEYVSPDVAERIQEALKNVSGSIFQYTGQFLANILKSGLAILNILSLIFITPLITFYVLRDWDVMVGKIDTWLPRKYAATIREQMQEIDLVLSGYIRGQTNVCLLMGLFYGIGLSFVRLDFGLFIGFATGIFTFIPYIGFMFGLIAGLIVAFFQFGLSIEFGVVIGVFMAGQILESNFITPKLVGERIGLHPAWVVFGLLAGAALFGFLGVLLALPMIAIIGVLSRFSLQCYLKSPLYQEQIIDKK